MKTDWKSLIRPCHRCGQPGRNIEPYCLFLCEEHESRFRKNQAAGRRFKERHPYRKAVSGQNIRARDCGAEGTFTEEEWLDLIARYKYRCLRCHNKVPLTIDHIVSFSKGGTNWISNIQPLCGPCNYNKKARIVDYRS